MCAVGCPGATGGGDEGKLEELDRVENQVAENEYLRRPFFVVQIAELGRDGFRDAQGEPIAALMEGIVKREGRKLTGVSSDTTAEVASELYRRVLSETARMMMDDETSTVEVDILGLIVEEVFGDYAEDEMVKALSQRAGAMALLEREADRRGFPHETVRSYFFAEYILDHFRDFPQHGAPNGLHRVPLSADDFRIFNRAARRRPVDIQRKFRKTFQNTLRGAVGHDYLVSNAGGLLLALAPLENDEGDTGERLYLGNLELRGCLDG